MKWNLQINQKPYAESVSANWNSRAEQPKCTPTWRSIIPDCVSELEWKNDSERENQRKVCKAEIKTDVKHHKQMTINTAEKSKYGFNSERSITITKQTASYNFTDTRCTFLSSTRVHSNDQHTWPKSFVASRKHFPDNVITAMNEEIKAILSQNTNRADSIAITPYSWTSRAWQIQLILCRQTRRSTIMH